MLLDSFPYQTSSTIKGGFRAGPHYCSAGGRGWMRFPSAPPSPHPHLSWSLSSLGLGAFSAAPIQPPLQLPSNSAVGQSWLWGWRTLCYEEDTCFSQRARANCSHSSAATADRPGTAPASAAFCSPLAQHSHT